MTEAMAMEIQPMMGADAKEAAKAMGVLQTIEYQNAHNDLLRYSVLFQVKESKAYKEYGITWEQYCDRLGLQWRNVDRVLADMRPIYDNFSERFASLLGGVSFSKVRYLGRQAEVNGGVLQIDGETVDLSSKDDVETLLEQLKKKHKKAVQERDDQISALKKVSETKQKHIDRMAKDIAKYERESKEGGFQPGEEAYSKEIVKIRNMFDGLSLKLDPDNPASIPEDATPRMKAEFVSLMDYIYRLASSYRDAAVTAFGAPDPSESWHQDMD